MTEVTLNANNNVGFCSISLKFLVSMYGRIKNMYTQN